VKKLQFSEDFFTTSTAKVEQADIIRYTRDHPYPLEGPLMSPSPEELVATVCFGAAVFHTFCTKFFAIWADRCKQGSLAENILHYMAEVEVVFGLWAGLYLFYLSLRHNVDHAVNYLETVNFTEAVFVFVIMTMAATKPVMTVCTKLFVLLSELAPKRWQTAAYFILTLTLAPVLGSFITEPAAMVVAALLLRPLIFVKGCSPGLRYGTLAVLLVNVSIGGTLTHFAAPPVIMVASKWNWDFMFMLKNFGWKSAIAVCISACALFALNFKELNRLQVPKENNSKGHMPVWMFISHLVFIALVVRYHTSMAFFLPLFLLFIGWSDVTKEYQDPLKLREALLVGFFLGGLVTLGQLQRWWITPLVSSLEPLSLFLGATTLTAITDNAALTYLGTLVPGLSEVSKYVLVAGAVAGGGLTVIANAPNPIAVGLLKEGFGEGSINPFKLLVAAIPPTTLACICYWFL
jgi:predicted cation transporter